MARSWHTLTNTGNGTDSFLLTLTDIGGDYNLGSLAIYADADGNGVPDNATNLNNTSVSLPRDGTFTFVVVGYAPGTGVVDGDLADVSVTADSQVYEAVPADDPADITNTDRAIITADAVINVTKSANVTSGPTGTVIEYTLTYTNTGNNTATNVTLSDPIPAGTTYVGGDLATWNGAALTDAAAGDPAGISFTGGAGGTVTAVITSVAPNVTGQIKFRVVVDATTAPGVLINTGSWTYDPDGGGVKPVTPSAPTNDVPFTVLQTRNVGANDSTTVNTDTGSDDVVEVASAVQGATVSFSNEIWNQGNGTDSFNIQYTNVSFPAGSSITLYKDDGVNVLQDTNGDFIPDTGPVAPGARYTVIVKVTLPPDFDGTAPAGPYELTKTATSTATGVVAVAGDQDDNVTDRLLAIVGNTVDLENAGGLADGGNNTAITNGGSPWTTRTVNPGANATFVLKVQNTSAVSDTYTFGAAGLPVGWTVNYYADGGAGDCSTTSGASVLNTGLVPADNVGTPLVNEGERVFCGVVSVPALAAPGNSDITFSVVSPTSGALDSKLDRVSVNTVRDIQIYNPNANTVYPGGTVTYTHTITNNGNVPEGVTGAGESDVNLTAVPTLPGWTTTIYYDANNDTILDISEVVSDLSFVSGAAAGLAPGESVQIYVKVTAPAGAADLDVDVTTVTATTVGAINTVGEPAVVSNTDTTTVNAGQIRLYKSQALDANCDGAEIAAGPYVTTALSAKPGACIIYRIVAQNEGTSPATSVLVNDSVPTYTTHNVVNGAQSVTSATRLPNVTQGSLTAPADGATGNVQANFGTINGGASATLHMSVQIDN